MEVSIIVPTNSIRRINGFINSYEELGAFKKITKLVIIGNGEVTEDKIKNTKNIEFIRYNKEIKSIVPFVDLRATGMINSNSDFFMFLDDDHRFKPHSDNFLVDCYNFLDSHPECGILHLKKNNKTKHSYYIKKDAHFWTYHGLFLRNIDFKYDELTILLGACEELLFSYEIINESYIPYEIWNSPITRSKELPNDYKELNDPSYNEKLLDKNIIGYIRKKYDQESWKFYGNLKRLTYPRHLRVLLKSRLSNLI